jgi:hypothetical protein
MPGVSKKRHISRAERFACKQSGQDHNNLWDQTFRHGVIHETSGEERTAENVKPDQTSNRTDAASKPGNRKKP